MLASLRVPWRGLSGLTHSQPGLPRLPHRRGWPGRPVAAWQERLAAAWQERLAAAWQERLAAA